MDSGGSDGRNGATGPVAYRRNRTPNREKNLVCPVVTPSEKERKNERCHNLGLAKKNIIEKVRKERKSEEKTHKISVWCTVWFVSPLVPYELRLNTRIFP